MELRWLEAFIAVAEELHFGRAAVRLHMAQSPLSQAIKKLEFEVGVPLFERSTRSVALTPGGHALLQHAYRAMEQLDLAQRAARSASGEYGHVNIGFSGALNHLTLPPLTRLVRERFPDISLTLHGQILTVDAIQRIHKGSLDLSFVALPVDPALASTRVVTRERLGATVPSDHRLARRKSVALEELAEEDFIAVPLSSGSALYELMVRACLSVGFRPRVVQEVIDPYMVMSFVGAGVGVSLMPVCMAPLVPSGASFVPLDGEPVLLESALAWSPDNTSSALRHVLDVAEEVLPTPGPNEVTDGEIVHV